MVFIAQVCIPNRNRDYYDYDANGLTPSLGARVWVSFRQKTCVGIVVGLCEREASSFSLKPIDSLIDDEPLLSPELLALCQWMSGYYQSPLSEVIPLALPKKYRLGHSVELPWCDHYQLTCLPTDAHLQVAPNAHRQHALIDFLGTRVLSKKIMSPAGFSQVLLRALVTAGLVHVFQEIALPYTPSDHIEAPLALNKEQALAVTVMLEHLARYHCFLLHGVTGSGKTEVYFHLIERVLARKQQVLVLVPEIGLTPQLLARFRARFHEPMVVLHSHLNDTERQQAWQLAANERVGLVIGTRSAVFTPMPSLGLIVIDEEHDASFKQMEGVRYHARDTALMRAHFRNIPLVLGSATPCMESLHNCTLRKYTLLRLNQKALSATPLHYQIQDIRNQVLQHGITSATLTAIKAHLDAKNQVLVFINRRGFSPVLLCHQCGWMADCRACDSHLTLHRQAHQLLCHHCGLSQKPPAACPKCLGRELLPVGIGTQRVHDYLSTQCPGIAILRVDRDEIKGKHALDEGLARISSGEIQLIVGTQLLAKGHHFPRLTLVVVLDADNGFYNQDFRALERLGQLLTQVSGRAGRAEFPGEVIIQTHLPQHPLLNTLVQHGYDPFAEALLAMRQAASLPPYHYLALIRAQSHIEARVRLFLHDVKAQLLALNVDVLGPAPAPLARKANQYRMQLLIKSASRKKLQRVLTMMREALMSHKISQGVRWNIDVDPVDLS